MAKPKITPIIVDDTWQKVATNVKSGFVRVVGAPGKTDINAVYYHTYRHTGQAAPTDLDEGIPFDSLNMEIRFNTPVDIYVYVDTYGSGTTGEVRVDL